MQKFSLALVTGATSGIGEALCHLLAEQKINLLITGRNAVKLDQLARKLQSKVNVIPFVADLSTVSGQKGVVEKIREHVPDLVINNAGFGLYGEALSHSTEDEVQILDVNCNTVLELSLEAARSLRAQERQGTIVNIASVAAFLPFPYSAVYAASKAFVSQFSLAFDFELKPYGIRVLTACPGMVKTEFNERAGGKGIPAQHAFAMTAEYAAGQIWWQICKGKALHIFDWKNRVAIWLSRFMPRNLIMRALKSSIAERL